MERREARGGTLVLGGGFAGSYVARLLKRARRDDRLARRTSCSTRRSCPRRPPGRSSRATSSCRCARCARTPSSSSAASTSHDPGARPSSSRRSRARSRSATSGSSSRSERPRARSRCPGSLEHGVGFKDLADAIALRNRVLLQLERRRRSIRTIPRELGFVFVGAGYAGVEALAELHDMAHAALRSYPGSRDVPQRWVLVDAAPKILPEIPRRLGEYAARELARRGVEIHVVDDARVATTAARRCSPTARAFRRGRWSGRPAFARTRFSRSSSSRSTSAGGSSSTRRSASRAPTTCGRSATARRVPEREDARQRRSADVPARAAPGAAAREEPHRRPPKPYGYRMLGQVATLGRFKGIAELPGLHLWGFPGWFVTRTYHLYQLPLLTPEAPRRRRLDGRALLPPRHRRALDARPSARSSASD